MLYTYYCATPLLHSRSDHGSCGPNSPPRVWNPPRIPDAQTEAESKLIRASRTNTDPRPIRESAHRDHHPDQAIKSMLLHWCCCTHAAALLLHTYCFTEATHMLHHCCCTYSAALMLLMLYTCCCATTLLHRCSKHGSCSPNSPPRV